MATKLENLHRKSADIVEERTDLDEKKQINSDNRCEIKSIIDCFSDDSDMGALASFESALVSEGSIIEEKRKDNNNSRLETLTETEEYIENLEENLNKIQEMKRVSDLKMTDVGSEQDTQRRIGELQEIRELLDGEGSDVGKKENKRVVQSDSYEKRKSILESLRASVETIKTVMASSVLGVATIGNISEEYKQIISDRYQNADLLPRKVYDTYRDELCIRNSEYPPNMTAHYAPIETDGHKRGVYYNANCDMANPRGNGTTYFHELGHMIDNASTGFIGNTSDSIDFRNALISDGQRLLSLYKNLPEDRQQRFLRKIYQGNAHSFSDLIDATTGGELHGAYGHSREYWETDGNLQAEAFAHFFEASMGCEEKKELLQNFFPTAFGMFNGMLKNIVANQKELVLERTHYGR